jgi:hypothetical protein
MLATDRMTPVMGSTLPSRRRLIGKVSLTT